MALDLDKITEYTGIKAETNEEFIDQFQKKYYTEDQIFKDKEVKDRIFGRAFGSATTGIKQYFDAEGIEITGDDLKQPIEAVVKLGTQKLKERLTNEFSMQKAELEKTAGLTADEKIKEFQDNLAKSQAKVKDYEKLLKQKADEFEQLNTSKAQELKQFKLGIIQKEASADITWNPDKDDYSKKGFLQDMREKYVIDFDENGEDYIADRKTGERIKAEGSHSTFVSPKELYKQEAIKAGMAAVNPKAGQKPAPQRTPAPSERSPSNPSPAKFSRPRANTGWRPPAND